MLDTDTLVIPYHHYDYSISSDDIIISIFTLLNLAIISPFPYTYNDNILKIDSHKWQYSKR